MKLLDYPPFKALNKVSPGLVTTLIDEGVRDFTSIAIDGPVKTDWFGILGSSAVRWDSAAYSAVIASAKPAFGSALISTPNHRLELRPNGDCSFTNNRSVGLARSKFQAAMNATENELSFGTYTNICAVVNLFKDAAFDSLVVGATRVAKATLTPEGHTELSGICSMFGLEYLKDVPVLVERSTAHPVISSNTAAGALALTAAWPKVITSVAMPGVQFLLVGVPVARLGADFYVGKESSYGSFGQAYADKQSVIEQASLDALLLATNSTEVGLGTYSVVGQQDHWFFAVPVRSSSLERCRVWRCDTKFTFPTTAAFATVKHMGYRDSRFGTEEQDLFIPILSAANTMLLVGDMCKNVDGTTMTLSDIQAGIANTPGNHSKVFRPLMGPLGDIPFSIEGVLLTGSPEQLVFDDEPDRVFTVTQMVINAKRLATSISFEWYETYHKTGLGVYTPSSSQIQTNTLKKWEDDGLAGLGVVSYGSGVPVSSTLIEELQVRQRYKTARQKACLTDNFYSEVELTPGLRWGTVKEKLDAAGMTSVFFAPLYSTPSNFQPLEGVPPKVLTFSRDQSDGPITKVEGLSSVTMTYAAARELALDEMAANSTVNVSGFSFSFQPEELEAVAAVQDETVEVGAYGNPNRLFVGLNMAYAFQFPWESLGNSGYPTVKEMPRQNAIMSTIFSTVYYKRFGTQVVKLMNQLSASKLIFAISAK